MSAIVARDASGNFKVGQLQDGTGVSSVDVAQRLLDDETGAHAILWDTSNCTLRYQGQTKFDWKNLRFSSLTTDGFLKTSNSNGTISVDTTAYVPTSTTVNGHALTGNVSVTAADLGVPLLTGNNTFAGTQIITGTLQMDGQTNSQIQVSDLSSELGIGLIIETATNSHYIGLAPKQVTYYANDHTVKVDAGTPTADRAISYPDRSGTVALLENLSGDVSSSGTTITVSKLNGTSLAGLATGLLKNTTSTGVPTIAVAGTDYLAPAGSGAALTGITSNQIVGSGTLEAATQFTLYTAPAASTFGRLTAEAQDILQLGSDTATPANYATQWLKSVDVTTGQGGTLYSAGGRGNGTNASATGSSGGPVIIATQAANPTPVTVTASTSTDQFTGTSHGLFPGAVVRFTNSGGALPTGISAATSYFVISANQTANTFMVSSSLRGSPKVFTTSNVDTAANTITVTAHGYTNTPTTAGTAVRFTTSGTLPSPLAVNTTYWVIASGLTADVFKVSTTPTGAAVDITTTGTGDHFVQQWEGPAIDITGTGSGTNTVTTYEGVLLPRLEVSPSGGTTITASNSQASATDGALLVRYWNTANSGFTKLAMFQQYVGVYNSLYLYDPSGNPYNLYAGYGILAAGGGVPFVIYGSGTGGAYGLAVYNSNGVQRYFQLANNNTQYDWMTLGQGTTTKVIPANTGGVIHQTFTAGGGHVADIGGEDLTIGGGPATGSSAKPGSTILATALPGATTTTQGYMSTRRYDSAQPVTLTDNTATNLTYISCGYGKYLSVEMNATVFVTDGSNEQVQNSTVSFSVANRDDSTVTISTVDTTHKTLLATGGTLTPVTYTVINSPKTYTFSSITSNYIYLTTEHRLRRGDMVTFSNSGGALPTGISAATQYYVRDTDSPDMFKISTTPNGTALSVSGGSGTTTVSCAGVLVKVQADTSLTPTTMQCKWSATAVHSNGVASFFPLPVYSPQN